MLRFVLMFLGLLVAAGIIFSAVALYIGPAQVAPLPVLYAAPDISLTDARGNAFSSASLAGKVWVADLFFTSCPTMCPTMTDHLSQVMAAYGDESDLHIVSISVDPDTDTPERLREYAAFYKADLDRWHFLRGPIEEVAALSVDGLKLGVMEDMTQHSERFVLVDRKGMIRGYYHGMEAGTVPVLVEDIERLLKE